MKYDFITFRSVTIAQRGERTLSAAGIRSSVQRTPRWMEEQGCGYCLRLQSGFARQAVEVLEKNQLKWRKVYTQREDGILEELAL